MGIFGAHSRRVSRSSAWGLLPLMLIIPPTPRTADQIEAVSALQSTQLQSTELQSTELQSTGLQTIELQAIDLGTADWFDEMEFDSPWPDDILEEYGPAEWDTEPADAAAGNQGRNVRVIAHRGDSARAPENTIAAFRSAEQAGIQLIETDIRVAQDGSIVVMHDASVDRTTNGSGSVANLTALDLGVLDAGSWSSPQYAGERLPFWSDVLNFWQSSSSTTMLLELKGSWSIESLQQLAQDINNAGISDRVIVISFDYSQLVNLNSFAPSIPVGFLTFVVGDELKQACSRPGIRYCIPGIESFRDSPEAVQELQDLGIVLFAGSDDPGDWSYLVSKNVDAILTNRPTDLQAWLASRN